MSDTYGGEIVGMAKCVYCTEYKKVHMSKKGLCCNNCLNNNNNKLNKPTYTPSLRNKTDNNEFKNNLDNFEHKLDDIGFNIELQDGSVYKMNKIDSHAVLLKYGNKWEEFISELASKVAEYYEKKCEPTKFSEYSDWGTSKHDKSKNNYNNHSELAPVVSYRYLRNAKMQLILSGLSGEEESPNVIGIGDNEITHYTDTGRITVPYKRGDK